MRNVLLYPLLALLTVGFFFLPADNATAQITFYVEAHHTANSEGDDFVFAFSTDGANYTDMVTVAKTADDDMYQSFDLPADLVGTLYIRAMDMNRSNRADTIDTLFVNHMYILSSATVAAPGAASAPSPANGATGININADLSWQAGTGASSYEIYLGTSSPPPLVTSQGETSYDPGTLLENTTYIWRVDEVSSGGTTNGVEWTFTTGTVGQIEDQVATSELLIDGTIIGDYVSTHSSDDSYEMLREVLTGNGRKQASTLEHSWTFDVAPGSTITFHVEAYRPANGEGDDFVFAYSTDGVNFVDMITLSKAADDNSTQLYGLPSSTQGLLTVRVTDTDRKKGNSVWDSLYVDHIFIRSE